MKLLLKLIFKIKKPQVVIVAGEGACTAEAVFRVLSSQFRVKKFQEKPKLFHFLYSLQPYNLSLSDLFRGKILIFETKLDDKFISKFGFLIKKSTSPILVATTVGDILPDKDFF